MIRIDKFKGEQAVILESKELKVVLLPGIGGKIASVYRKDRDFELLFQNKNKVYNRPQVYSPFDKFDAAGFDDAFPSIDEGIVVLGSRSVKYPDHGEIWSAAFEFRIEQDNVIMSYKSRILPYVYNKTVCLEADKVVLKYHISNIGEYDIPCMWAMHCLIRCEENMELLFPKDTVEMLNVKASRCLGGTGAVHSYPKTKSPSGEPYRLDRVCPDTAVKSEKYYINGKVNEGFCGAIYPDHAIRYSVSYDRDKLPYLGFWITEGEFRGDYNCALEPSNGFYDSIETARKNDCLYVLKKGCILEFDLAIRLESR